MTVPESVGSVLLFDVLPDNRDGGAATGGGEVARAPKHTLVVAPSEVGALLAEKAAGDALQAVDESGDGHLGGIGHEEVDVVVLAVHLDEFPLEVAANLGEGGSEALDGVAVEHLSAIFGHKDQMRVNVKNTMSTVPDVLTIAHRPSIFQSMKVLKGHRFRLDLDEAGGEFCGRTAGICRFLWNLALEQRSQAWKHDRHSVRYHAQAGELVDLKVFAPWVAEAPSHCLQQTLRDLDGAFQNFFSGRAAYPTFRKKFQRDSFRFPDPKQFVVDETRQRIKLPKLGWVPYRNGKGRHALKLSGAPKSVTVSREGKHWFISVLCESEVAEPRPNLAPGVGVDLGVAQAITLSTGEVLAVLGRPRGEERRLARLQRALQRKKRGSRNRSKARTRLAEFQARIARRRRDAIHKATTHLAKNHGLVVVEDLRVKDMTASAKGTMEVPGRNVKAKAGLNRVILDKGFGEIRRQLDYKCRWYGSTLVAVNPAYTSQQCSACGYTEAGNRKTQASFVCLTCGHAENADQNAAKNILAAGQAVRAEDESLAMACGGKPSGARRSRKVAA